MDIKNEQDLIQALEEALYDWADENLEEDIDTRDLASSSFLTNDEGLVVRVGKRTFILRVQEYARR